MTLTNDAPVTVERFRKLYDNAAGHFGQGMAQYEKGEISPREFGVLKRRMDAAEIAWRRAAYALVPPTAHHVEQCDREAAADLHHWYAGDDTSAEAAMRKGDYDDDDRVTAFARHRLAALASAPACSASPDHADIMETIENAADDWQKQGYATALAEVRDMANVGRSLLERIADHSSEGPLKGWHPADCPTEVVCDLLNMLADASAPAVPREAIEAQLTALEAKAAETLWTGSPLLKGLAVYVRAMLASAPAGDGDRYSAGYSQGTIDAGQQHQWMQDKAWQDAVLMLVHYSTLAERTWLVGHEEATRRLAEWWGHARALADTKTTDDIAALARPRAAVGGRDSALRQAAQEAYRVCAEARHVQLGDKVRNAILALQSPPAKVEG